MRQLAQVILGEPSIVFCGSVIAAGVGWTVKKLLDIERRLIGIEARCRFHKGKD